MVERAGVLLEHLARGFVGRFEQRGLFRLNQARRGGKQSARLFLVNADQALGQQGADQVARVELQFEVERAALAAVVQRGLGRHRAHRAAGKDALLLEPAFSDPVDRWFHPVHAEAGNLDLSANFDPAVGLQRFRRPANLRRG